MFQSAKNFLFSNLLRARLDHDNTLVAARHNHVKFRGAGFGVSGVGDVFPVDNADAHGADQVVERDIGNRQRGAGADNAEDARIVLRIRRQDHGDDLRLGEITLREQGPHGPVDHPAGESFLLGHSAFALDVSAGDLAGRIRVFAVIAGQREKALIGFRARGGGGGDQNNRIAPADHHGTARLLGEFTGLDRQFATVEIDFKFVYFHLFVCRLTTTVRRTSFSAESSAKSLP